MYYYNGDMWVYHTETKHKVGLYPETHEGDFLLYCTYTLIVEDNPFNFAIIDNEIDLVLAVNMHAGQYGDNHRDHLHITRIKDGEEVDTRIFPARTPDLTAQSQ